MENYIGMSELKEIIFRKKSTISEQKVAQSSILSSFLTEDFPEKIRDVLFCKMFIIHWGYQKFFIGHIQKVLSSHEDYLRYLMSICLREYEDNKSVFDSFIGVCALVQYVSEHTLTKTGVDFRDLNPDIFMVFYRKVLKTSFLQQKGFYRFLEYIRTHKYLEWKRKINDFTFVSRHNKTITDPTLYQKIQEESIRYRFQKLPIETNFSKKVNARSLAQEVLSNTSVELPVLPSVFDLIKTMVENRKKQIENEAETNRRIDAALTHKTLKEKETSLAATRIKVDLVEEISDLNLGLNLASKTNYSDKQQEDIVQHENLIQAVIRRNSKNTTEENANNQISKEAEGILEHLKSTIKSLTEVLDECDKE